jgi:hypothetical protein
MNRLKLLLAIIIYMNSLSATYAASCPYYLKRFFHIESGFQNNDSLKFTEKLSRIETFTNWLRKGKDDPTPALDLKIAKRLEILQANIFSDNHSENEREWRTFFRIMEGKFIGFKRYKKISLLLEANPRIGKKKFINELRSMNFSDEFINYMEAQLKELGDLKSFRFKLKEEMNSTLVDLGNDFREYQMVRGELENLLTSADCNSVCLKNVKLLISELGANSEKESLAHPIFFKNEKSPSFEELQELLYQEPLFVMTEAKRERNAELKSFFLSYLNQPKVVDSFFGILYKSSPLGKSKAIRVFKIIYDAHARNEYFPKLNKIIFGSSDPKTNAEILIGQESLEDLDELLITFARRIDTVAKSKWKSIKEYAKEGQQELFNRMEEAEIFAQARGDLSPTNDDTKFYKLAILGIAGAGALSYFYFDRKPSSIDDALDNNIPNNEDERDGPHSSGGTVTDLGDVPPTDRGVVPYDEDNSIMLDGEEDQAIEELVTILYQTNFKRGPSSIQYSIKGKRNYKNNFFSALWCTVFTCE